MQASDRNAVSYPIIQEMSDEDGFLADPSTWPPELAAQTGELEGIHRLGDRHWRVINHLRDKFFRLGGP